MYSVVTHTLTEVVMDTYHVMYQDIIKKVVKEFFLGIHIRFTVGEFTIAWKHFENGIITRCKISPILFVMGMSLITTYREARVQRWVLKTSNRHYEAWLTSHVQGKWYITFTGGYYICYNLGTHEIKTQEIKVFGEDEGPRWRNFSESIVNNPIKKVVRIIGYTQ